MRASRRATTSLSRPILLLGCLALLGCERSDPAPRTRSLPLLNASDDPGHPAVGALAGPPGPCTATLLGTRTVLAAAHCMAAPGTYTFTLGTKTYAVAEVKPHFGWHEVTSFPELPSAFAQLIGTFSIHDLGVALLADPVTGVAPMKIARQKPAIGSPVTLVGSVRHEPIGDAAVPAITAAVKQQGQNLVGAIGEEFVLYGTKGGMKGMDVWSCMSDSGGPTLIVEEGEERILGVHSMSNCASYKPGGAAYVQDTRVSTHLDWLKAQSAELADPKDGGPPTDLAVKDGGSPRPDAIVSGELGPPAPEASGCDLGGRPGGQGLLSVLLLLALGYLRAHR